MRKGLVIFGICFLLVSMSFISAFSFPGFFGLTGKVIETIDCSNSNQQIGDVDGNGVINQNDAQIVGEIYVQNILPPNNICCADTNQDGVIDIKDSLKISRIAEGLENSPGVCNQIDLTCTDFDGGENYLVKSFASKGTSVIGDGCISGGIYDGWLREAICQKGSNGEETATWVDIECPDQCQGGVCVVAASGEGDGGGGEAPKCILQELLQRECFYLERTYLVKRTTQYQFEVYYSGVKENFELVPLSQKLLKNNVLIKGVPTSNPDELELVFSGEEKPIDEIISETCNGCKNGDQCLPYGFRTSINSKFFYCDIDSTLKEQKTKDPGWNWAKCQNNFECRSNICTNDECVDVNYLTNQGNSFKNSLTSILCRILHPFNRTRYNSCLSTLFK